MWLVRKEMKDPRDLQDRKVNVACLVSANVLARAVHSGGSLQAQVLSTQQPASAFARIFPSDSRQIAALKCILRL